ncbi:MAG: transcriptional regulator, PucR family [Solirubrobacterales bacterium]|jgi:purine catabolism regulator|nr:transcriptional regulator, PucR family [Solirubrobacterales bacterium]
MLTVKGLANELNLHLAAGEAAGEREVRWVHITELNDPTPWLSGGELLLTTGMQLDSADRQRRFVRLLAEREVAALGFGTGFDHGKLPKALVGEAESRGLPLFEVPYEMPFIAITEAAANRLVNEHYDVLSRGIAVNERLERLVLEGGGLDEIAREIAGAVGGSSVVLDGRGERLAHGGRRLPGDFVDGIKSEIAARGGAAAPFVPSPADVRGRALAHPVSPRGGEAEAWLVVMRRGGELGDFERMCVRQAAIVVALEMMREHVARDTERRLSGELLAAILSGRLGADDVRDRVSPFGIGERAAVLVFELADPSGAQATLEQALRAGNRQAIVATHPAGRRELLCAVVPHGEEDPVETAAAARTELEAAHGRVRAAASRPLPTERARHAFHEARCALEATAFVNGTAPEVASYRDLGAFTLLLSVQDAEALQLYCESVLGPIENSDERYAAELLRSLEAYIDRNGHWERAANDCYCHRHTLRYRIKRIEDLTGRDLGRANDRVEMWLALRAKELISS